MLQVKSVIILNANPGILKCGGGIKMWMQLCVESESYLGFGKRLRMRKKYCEAKKDAKRVVYMAMNQKAQKAVEDESPNKVLGRRKMLLGLVVLKMKVGL